MTNIALIGKGYWGSILKRYVEESRDLCLKVVCDSKSDLRREVYKKVEIDAVIVATPNQTHYSIVRDALASGKHIMCEKPLTLKTEECCELKILAEEKAVVLCTDYTHTFSKSLQEAQKLIKSGEIGDICGIEMQMRQFGRFGRGSVYWILASHMLAVLDMFVSLEKLEFSKSDMVVHRGNVETGIIRFNSGSLNGYIFASLNYPLGKERSIIIYGSRGTIVYAPLLAKPLQVNENSFEFDESNNLKHALEYFHKVMNGELKPNLERAVLVTKILEAVQSF